MSELALVQAEEWPVFRGESYEEHVSTWLEVDRSVQGHYWMLGAVAASLKEKYGEDAFAKFASEVGSSRRRVYEYAETYEAYNDEKCERSHILSFHHHTVAARSEDPAQALETAEREELSTRELEQLVKTGEVPEKNVHFSSESPEWYTPPHVIDAVLEVLGEIDLDPCADAERSVPAAAHLTEDDDGLGFEWSGRVYMNPPYGSVISQWVAKLARSYEGGDIQAAVALVPARTDTEWFSRLRDYPRCFIRGRLKFSGHENSAPFPSAAFYLGPRDSEGEGRFAEVFGRLGDVFERVGRA